ncbi:hypothetical protein J6590_094709 [Homalodisca vitripennis]|nr:hypothetical protein J6590_094709 [Homalodisca vitripennis]
MKRRTGNVNKRPAEREERPQILPAEICREIAVNRRVIVSRDPDDARHTSFPSGNLIGRPVAGRALRRRSQQGKPKLNTMCRTVRLHEFKATGSPFPQQLVFLHNNQVIVKLEEPSNFLHEYCVSVIWHCYRLTPGIISQRLSAEIHVKSATKTVQNEIIAPFRHQRHLDYKGDLSGYSTTIQCSLDEAVFLLSYQWEPVRFERLLTFMDLFRQPWLKIPGDNLLQRQTLDAALSAR